MIEWKIGNEGWDDTPEVQETPAVGVAGSPTAGKSPRRRHLLIGIGLTLALLAVTGIFLQWVANRNVMAAQADVQSMVDQEMWALESGNWELYESLIDQQTPAKWYRQQQAHFVQSSQRGTLSAEIADFALVQPDLALAEVKIHLPDGQIRRETWAYRQVGNTWYRTTAPAGNLWVRQMTRETANLRFVYHQDDAARIEPLIPALQQLYTQLLTDFSLAPLPNRRELQIVLSVQPADETFVDTSRRYDLSFLATADAQSIRRELGTQLIERVTRQFHASAGEMSFLLNGIRRWEIAEWMGEPDPESRARIAQTLEDKPFIPLLVLQPSTPPAYLDIPTAEALAETFVEYLVWRKGRDALKTLIREIKEYHTWTALIESGLRMSYRDVADGWWRFLARRYAPPRSNSPDKILADLRWMLQLERQALKTHHQELFQSLLDPHAPREWQSYKLNAFLRVETIELPFDMTVIREWGHKNDMAWVVVTHAFPHLQIYRFADGRWYLTSPDTAFSGPPLKVRTKYFEFRYREPDAGLTQSIVANVDELYEQATQDLGLGIDRSIPLTVELVYSLDPTEYQGSQPDLLHVPSPQLLGDTAEYRLNLGATIVNALLSEIINPPNRWLSDPMLYGVMMWEVGQWSPNPILEARKHRAVQRQLESGTSPLLTSSPSFLDVTIAEYVAQTYGRHRLADIVRAAGEHQNLADLISAALGVDLATFEAGWQAYLEQTYGRPDT